MNKHYLHYIHLYYRISCNFTNLLALFSTLFPGHPEPEIKWMYKNKPIDNKRVESKMEDGALVFLIKNATTSDSGKYTMTCVNSEGKASHDIKIKVEKLYVILSEAGFYLFRFILFFKATFCLEYMMFHFHY